MLCVKILLIVKTLAFMYELYSRKLCQQTLVSTTLVRPYSGIVLPQAKGSLDGNRETSTEKRQKHELWRIASKQRENSRLWKLAVTARQTGYLFQTLDSTQAEIFRNCRWRSLRRQTQQISKGVEPHIWESNMLGWGMSSRSNILVEIGDPYHSWLHYCHDIKVSKLCRATHQLE